MKKLIVVFLVGFILGATVKEAAKPSSRAAWKAASEVYEKTADRSQAIRIWYDITHSVHKR
ncbi:MAG: hypothetical protein K6U74_18785 [Firmicutes bacterium]|nr:hypothetical protein [Bacillota bacterium]